jgi:hypothetical protein
MTPTELKAFYKQRASIASNTRWGREQNRTKATSKARAALYDKFLREADPEGRLSIEERERRAASLRKAHYMKLAVLSAKARRERA